MGSCFSLLKISKVTKLLYVHILHLPSRWRYSELLEKMFYLYQKLVLNLFSKNKKMFSLLLC